MNILRRYRRISRLVYFLLAVIIATILAVYINARLHSAIRGLTDRFLLVTTGVDTFLDDLTDQLHGVDLLAEQFLIEDAYSKRSDWLVKLMHDNPTRGYYSLGALPSCLNQADYGNCVGWGSISNRSPAFYRELRMALSLFPAMQEVVTNIASVNSVSYSSRNAFTAVYPWENAADLVDTNDQIATAEDLDLYSASYESALGVLIPDYMANVSHFTRLYRYESNTPLIVSCVSSIFDSGDLCGNVSADVTIADLNQFLAPMGSSSNCAVLIVNEYEQVLAHSHGFVHPNDANIRSFTGILPADLSQKAEAILANDEKLGWFVDDKDKLKTAWVGSWIITERTLSYKNWRIIMLISWTGLVKSLLAESLLFMGTFLVGLLGVYLTAERLSRHEFIRPADYLVAHIDRAKADPSVPLPPVPASWRPWFEVISRIFGENKRLLGELQAHHDHLDVLVAERTAELQRKNHDFEAVNKEIKKLNERLEEENKKMGADLDVVRRLQSMVLPRRVDLTAVKNLDISYVMEPAEEVGGDYLDILNIGSVTKIGFGDVTGHGLESGVLMIMVQTAAWSLLEIGVREPVQFLAALNRMVYHNTRRIGADRTISLTFVDLAPRSVTICGQHEEVLIVRQNGQLEVIDTVDLGLPLGWEADITGFLVAKEVPFGAGDLLALVTDGVTEAENPAGEYYGIERCCACLQKNYLLAAEEIKTALVADIDAFIGSQQRFDDVTIIVLKKLAA